jgi:ssDNA-binding Zn-finger/Zn-ribbon topoisomerase 1
VPRRYETKAKNAQEAHEAIRPTELPRRPRDTKSFLDADQAKLYELIWLRTVASQMESAELERTTVDINADVAGRHLDLRATGTVVKFDGFLALYQEGRDEDPDDEDARRLPQMTDGERLAKRSIAADQHFTEPPPRYSEASLVKRMEELGIGRPSTYASILQVLKDRKYVRIDKRRLIPEDRGRIVVAFLESFFARYVEYDFTASLEDQLDLISNNEVAWRDVLRDFWRDFIGAIDETKDLRITAVIDALDALLGQHLFPPREDGTDPRVCPTCSTGRLSLKLSKFGAFIGCTNYPECRYTRPLSAGENGADIGTKKLGEDPQTGLDVTVRSGRFGPYLQIGETVKDGDKPKRAGLPKGVARQEPRGWGADPRRHRPLRALCAAREDLRQSRIPRRSFHHRPQSRRDADCREDRQRSAQGPFRRRPGPGAWRSSGQGRPRCGEKRPLRTLCESQRRQRDLAGRQNSRICHSCRSCRLNRRQGRAQRTGAARAAAQGQAPFAGNGTPYQSRQKASRRGGRQAAGWHTTQDHTSCRIIFPRHSTGRESGLRMAQ